MFLVRRERLNKIPSSKFKLSKNSRPKTTYRAFVEGRADGEITDNEVSIEFKNMSKEPLLSGIEGLRDQQVILAAYESSKTKRAMRVNDILGL